MDLSQQHVALKKTARHAGFWYLMLAVFGIIGFMVFQSKIYMPDNPSQTLQNLIDFEWTARFRLFFELLIVLSQALAAFWFYKLFKGMHNAEAWALGVWGTVNAVVIMLSGIAMASAIQIADSTSFALEEKTLIIGLLTSIISHAWTVGGLFFGLWLIPMGHIVITSKKWPIWLGRTLILGGIGYILSTLIIYMGYKEPILNVLTIPATVGEFWMIGYLLIYGLRENE